MLLGEKDVGFGVDRDVIRIGQGEDWYRDRRFRTLHFIADGNDVHMMSVRLVYFNGFGEDFRVDQLIRQGDDLPIDLRGERSYHPAHRDGLSLASELPRPGRDQGISASRARFGGAAA